jgi:hypothetical protein
MMRLYHTTPRKNLPSIWREGLRIRYHGGHQAVIWCVLRPALQWAEGHTVERHLTGGGQVASLRFNVSDSWAVHHGGYVFKVDHDIPAGRIFVCTSRGWMQLNRAAHLGLLVSERPQ